VADPSPEFEPDGTWFSMAVQNGAFWVVNANQGNVEKVLPDGTVSRVLDGTVKLGHAVPTAIAAWNGRFFLGTSARSPSRPGSPSW